MNIDEYKEVNNMSKWTNFKAKTKIRIQINELEIYLARYFPMLSLEEVAQIHDKLDELEKELQKLKEEK